MHFAGYVQAEESVENPDKYFENNTNNSIKLFQICKNNDLNNTIFSSTAAYGELNTDNLINENCY